MSFAKSGLSTPRRKRGEYTRGEKDQPRHIFQTEASARTAANDSASRADALRREAREKDAALLQRSRDMHARHQDDSQTLHASHIARTQEIARQAEIDQGRAKADVREQYRPVWRDTFRKQQNDLTAFEDREADFLGRMQNAVDAVSLRLRVLQGTKR